MTRHCTTWEGMETNRRPSGDDPMQELRSRMVRELELYLSHALAAKGQTRRQGLPSCRPQRPQTSDALKGWLATNRS